MEPLLSDNLIKVSRGTNLQIGFGPISEKKTMKILFSDEKYFGIDGVHSSQIDRLWTVNRVDADAKSGIKQRRLNKIIDSRDAF